MFFKDLTWQFRRLGVTRQHLQLGGAWLRDTIRHYWHNPQERHLLGAGGPPA